MGIRRRIPKNAMWKDVSIKWSMNSVQTKNDAWILLFFGSLYRKSAFMFRFLCCSSQSFDKASNNHNSDNQIHASFCGTTLSKRIFT